MKLSAYSLGGRIVASLLVIVLMAGCGGDDKKTDKDAKGGSGAITMPKAVTTPPGADPSVSAEMGGNGFEKIAADSGWQTGTISPDQFQYIADPAAKKGGELRFAENDFPPTFRPFGKDASTTVIQMISSLIHEPLMTTNPLTLEFLPVLVSHWKVLPDGQTFYFRVDPNARFSDGYPVTTADIIETHRMLIDTGIGDPFSNELYGKYDSVVPVSKYILKVHSKVKEWKNLLYFSGIQVLPAHVLKGMSGEDFIKKFQWNLPPGSGPYVVLPENVEKQKSVTMTRVADWWQKDYPINAGQNNFDKIKMFAIEDENQMYERFRAGDLDFFHNRRAQWWKTKFDYEDIKSGKVQKRKIYTDNPQGITGFQFNTRRPPFNDPKVCEAFIHLFNREELLEKLMYNEYIISDSFFPNSDYANPSNPKYRYDPALAGKLLAEAGYTSRNAQGILVKNGKPFEIELPITSGSEHLMAPIQQSLQQAGIKMNIRIVDWPQQIKRQDERNFDLVYGARSGSSFPSPLGLYHSKMADKKNSANVTGFKNAKADELIDREQLTFSQAERVLILRQLDSILMESKNYALAWYAPFDRVVYFSHLHAPKFYLPRTGDYRSILSLWWIDRSAVMDKPGETDVKFWPEYDKQHPTKLPDYSGSSTGGSPGKGDSAGKPSVR